MTELELAQRLGVALAVGALVGAERHWRERGEDDGQRTAGLRTYTLVGMLGGIAGALEFALRGTGGGPGGIVVVGVFVAFATVFSFFQYREHRSENSYSVTSAVVGMVTFALGSLAVLGDMRLAGAAGVVLVAILAAREALHRFVEALTSAELRSAIVLLAMTFVVLPLVPTDNVGPFGGVSPARIWTLAILVAAISFAGYVAVKLLGERNGELVAGAVGGLLSSTATTVTNARRSIEAGETDRLVAGALGAGVVSYGRTALLVLVLAPALLPTVAPPLAAAGLVMAAAAFWLARRDDEGHVATESANPFDLKQVLQMAILLTAIAFATRAAAAWFGDAGAIAVSAITGLADVDAPVITVAGLFGNGLSAEVASIAMIVAVTSNTVAKAGYALMLGAWRFGGMFAAASAVALTAGTAVFFAARLLA